MVHKIIHNISILSQAFGIAIFAFAVAKNALPVFAETEYKFTVSVPDTPVLEISLLDADGNTTSGTTMNVAPTMAYAGFNSSDVTIRVGTSNSAGYNLTMNVSNTDLTSSSNNTIPTLGSGSYTCTTSTAATCNFTANTWGYKIKQSTTEQSATDYMQVPSTILLNSNNEPTNEDYTYLNFASRIDASQPAGEYATTITFLAVANAAAPHFIQDMTKDACAIFAEVENFTVYDKRDGNDYTVRYIDDNCWMTQNLRILQSDGASANTVTAENSNFSSVSSVTFSIDNAFNTHNAARAYSTGDVEKGVWYDFCAATAKTGSNSCSGSGKYSGSQDICPAGWHLPNSAEANGVIDYKTQFGPIDGGAYTYYCKRCNTALGNWWVASSSNTYQESINFNSTSGSLTVAGGYDRYNGEYIRCVRAN